MELNFDEFAIPTYEAWYQAAIETLKGASFDKILTTETYEGLVLQPLYRRVDTAHITHQYTAPGFTPFVRGTQAQGQILNKWLIAQESSQPTPAGLNHELRHGLANGQTALNIITDAATCNGADPDQMTAEHVGHGGVSLACLNDVAQAFEDIDLGAVPWSIKAGIAARPLAAFVIAHMQQQGQPLSSSRGCIAADPLGQLARNGTLPLSLSAIYDDIATVTRWAEINTPHWHTTVVDTTPYHDGGCNAVQELAIALATGAEYIRALTDRGLAVDEVARHMRFVFGLGANFFMEIAKLRAARLLWAQVVMAFGGDEDAQKMALHTRTGTTNKSDLNPHMNLLRTTIEALAGAVAGSESLHITPFDDPTGTSDEFSQRLARNQQIILQEEASLSGLIDPAGGTWYIEVLTDWLARQAWKQFQEIEASGGMLSALQKGQIQQEIARVAQARAANLTRRKDVLVGINMYTDSHDTITQTANMDDAYQERARQITAHRQQREFAQPPAPDSSLEAAVQAALSGATLNQLMHMAHPQPGELPTVTPIQAYRAPEPFEQLRKAAETYAARTGSRPRIFLANMGPPRQHSARANFTTSFFEVGGFEMVSNNGFDTVDDAVQAALDSGAQAVVICSTDETYPELVPPLVHEIKSTSPETIVILAGYPQDQVEAHRAVGIDEFIHIRANCYEINHWLHQQIGVTQDG